MLRAAIDRVNRIGLTVGLDHIGFEDVIRDADVPRSTVYRRWPYKDLFLSDLLRELARGASPALAQPSAESFAAAQRVMRAHVDRLATPEQRLALIAEVLRQGALAEFETFARSPVWRTYFALHATFLSLPDGDLRQQVQDALAESERAQAERLARAYEQVIGVLGLRLRPDAGATFETLATLGSAVIRGLVLLAPSSPCITSSRVAASPGGVVPDGDWSLPAYAVAGVVMPLLEPDPAVRWGEVNVRAVRLMLDADGWS